MTREEAIEIVRNIYQTDTEKEALAVLIPELAESEDERIRKDIVAAVEMRGDLTQGRKSEIYAYLEKQKEQKHPNGCFTCDEYKKGYEEGRRNGFTAGYNKAMKEVEQKEQKPVVTHGETYRVDTLGTQQVIAGKMPQKPAEWSEEDEKMIDTIASVLGQYIDYKTVSGTGSGYATPRYNKEIAWLESLRNRVGKEFLQPHWKPTEDQMKALLGAEGISRACGYPDNAKVLASLYEDLKKL